MTQDRWPEVVEEFDGIEADIERAMERLEASHKAEMDDMRRELAAWAQRAQAYRDRIAAKVEEDGK